MLFFLLSEKEFLFVRCQSSAEWCHTCSSTYVTHLSINHLSAHLRHTCFYQSDDVKNWQVRDVGARARAWALAKAPVNQFLPWEQEKEVYTTFDNFWALKTHKKSIIRRKAKSQKQDKHLKSPKNQTSRLHSERQVFCRRQKIWPKVKSPDHVS